MLSHHVLLRQVLRDTRFAQFTLVFFLAFFLCSLVLWLTGDSGETFFDGIWFSFQVVSTIGFGDVVTTHILARIIAMILSVISIFYLAIITGVVVNFFNQAIRIRQQNSIENYALRLEYLKGRVPENTSKRIAQIIEKLHRLEAMSREELDELSDELVENEEHIQKT